MTLVGIAIYLKARGPGASTVSRYGVPCLIVVPGAMTWTQLFSVVPPEPNQLIPAWIGVPLVLSAIAYALDRRSMAGMGN